MADFDEDADIVAKELLGEYLTGEPWIKKLSINTVLLFILQWLL